jgi:cytochrome c
MKKVLITLLFIGGISSLSYGQTKIPPNVQKLLQKNTCLACHNPDNKLVGPSYKEVMQKKKYTPEQIVELIYKPNPKNWPDYPPMAPMAQVPKNEALVIAKWIATLK